MNPKKMKKNNLIILIGNIASGKSSIAKYLSTRNYYIISRDAFRYMIHANDYKFEPRLEKAIKKSSLQTLENFMKLGVDLVWDECNMSRKTRSHPIELAKKYKYKVTAILLPKISKEASIERRLKNPHGNYPKKVWNIVWETFNLVYQPPKKSEGINEIIEI